MKKFVCLFLIAFLVPPVAAQDSEELPEVPELDIRKVVFDGEPFVAFTKKDTKSLLQMRIDFPKIELKLEKKSILLESAELQIEKTYSLAKNALEQKEILKSDNIRLQKKLDDAGSWYRHPIFWTIIGTVLGGGATVAVVYLSR